MRAFIVVGLLLGIVQAALAEEFTGYLIDNLCWNRPGHVAIDGAQLETRPQDHYLHCLLLSICKSDGYALLEEYDDAGTQKFRIKYQLDAPGNAMAIQLFEAEIQKGDRRFGDQVTVVGELGMDGMTISTTALSVTGASSSISTCSLMAVCLLLVSVANTLL